MFDINEDSVQKTEESSIFSDLTPSFHVIFRVICFFTTNGDITKNKWLRKIKNKVITLQFSDYNFATKIIHHRFFLENVPKSSCLKKKERKSFLEKKSL